MTVSVDEQPTSVMELPPTGYWQTGGSASLSWHPLPEPTQVEILAQLNEPVPVVEISRLNDEVFDLLYIGDDGSVRVRVQSAGRGYVGRHQAETQR